MQLYLNEISFIYRKLNRTKVKWVRSNKKVEYRKLAGLKNKKKKEDKEKT